MSCVILLAKNDNRQVKSGLFKLKQQQKIIMLIDVGCVFMNVQGNLIRVISDQLIGHDDLLIVLIMQQARSWVNGCLGLFAIL